MSPMTAAMWVLCLNTVLAPAQGPVGDGPPERRGSGTLPFALPILEFSGTQVAAGRGNRIIEGRLMAPAYLAHGNFDWEVDLRTTDLAPALGGRLVQWRWNGADPEPRVPLITTIAHALIEEPTATLRGWLVIGRDRLYASFFRETENLANAWCDTPWTEGEVAESVIVYMELAAAEPANEKGLSLINTSSLHHTFGLPEFLEIESDISRGSNRVLTGRIAQFSDSWHRIALMERALRVEQLAPAHGGKVVHWQWTGNDPNPQATLLWLIARALKQEPRATLRGWLVVGRIHLHGSFFRDSEDFGSAWIDTPWAPTEEAQQIYVYLELPPADPTP